MSAVGEERLGLVEALMVTVAAFVILPAAGSVLARYGVVGLVATEVIALVGPVAVALAATRSAPGSALGLALPSARMIAAALLAGAGGFYLASAGLERCQEWVAPLPAPLRDQMRELLVPRGGPRPLAVDLVAIALVPALCEEALFRGVLLRSLAAQRGPNARALALIITSVAFGCFHFSLYKLAPTAALGAVMGTLVLRGGSLWMAVIAHALNNALVIVFFRAGWEDPPGAHSPLWPLWLALALAALMLGVRNASPKK